MTFSTGLTLPKVLQGSDRKSWFKRFEVCAVANEMDDDKKLKRVPTLLRGRVWAIFDALPDTSTDTYKHLKGTLLIGFSLNTEEHRQSACESLSERKLRKSQESIDELARDIEKLLDKASPGLQVVNRNAEQCYYLLNALPEKVVL